MTALADAPPPMLRGHGMKGLSMLRRWVLVVTASVMTACTTPGPAHYPLAVQLADLRFAEAGLLEQSIGLDLRFTNPNPEPILAEGLRFVMEVDGRRFGTGVSDAAFEIPRLGEAVVPVTIRVQTGELINRLLALRAGELDYRITGDLFQSTGLAARPIAFSGDSSIVIPDLPGVLGGLGQP